MDAFPDISPNLVQVFTITEGLAPEEVEKYVTYPIEAAMTGLPGVRTIRSVSNFGLSVVNIYFEDSMDIYFSRRLVNERLAEAKLQIPEGFGTPRMGPISTGMGLVLFYYLKDETGKYSLEELRTLQDWVVKYNLRTVPGVTEVLGIGGYEKQYHVVVDPAALLRYDITLKEVIERIKKNNLNVGGQFIEQNGQQFIIRSVGLARGIDDLKRIVVKTTKGRPVYLEDIAKIKIGGAIRRGLQTRNGKGEVVAGMVIRLYGTNASTVIERVERKIAEINKMLPKGVKIVPYYQQRDIVKASVRTVSTALFQGIILVALVLFIFMGAFRPSFTVIMVLPFSVSVAFLAMAYFGISANLMSLGGIAIAIGMLVDGTIVMVENSDRSLRASSPSDRKREVILRACKEVGPPVVFAVAITVLVFLPLLSLRGAEGKTFCPLAYTTAFAMLGAFVFAVLFAPGFCDLFMPLKNRERKREFFLVSLLLRIYRPAVGYFVRRKILALSLGLLLVLFGFVVLPRLGSEFTPKLKEGTIIVRLTMDPSISLTESKATVLRVERRLLKIPEVKEVITRVGRGEVGAHTDPINSAEIYVILKPKSQWRRWGDQEFIEGVIRKELGNIPGVLLNLTQPIEMTIDELLEGVRAELVVKLFGDELSILKSKAEEIASVIRRIRGAEDVQVAQVSGTPQLVVRPKREALARYGLNIEDVQSLIRAAVGGTIVGEIFEGIKRFPIFVRYRKEARDTQEAINEILVACPDGKRVPLSEIATVGVVVGPRQITRENTQRFITVQCNVVGRDIGSFVDEAARTIEKYVNLPPGYYIKWGGQFRLKEEANKRLRFVVPLTLLGICLLLFSSFRSLKSCVLILINLPLALVGGICGLWLSGQHLSVPATVGFIALFGVALENGMVLVSCLNQLVKKGLALEEACVEGACLRLRPVLMTALTTALGLIPLLVSTGTGSEVQRPLATVVVGGLASATPVTLFLIPALYSWFAPRKEIELGFEQGSRAEPRAGAS